MKDPRVSVIIPSYRRYEYLLSTLSELLNADYHDFEILVADQNSGQTPVELEEIVRLHPNVFHLRVPGTGVVSARHEAVVRSTGDVLLFVDDDISINDPKFIGKHAMNYTARGVDAVVGREVSPGEKDRGGRKTVIRSKQRGRTTLVQECIEFPRHSTVRRTVCSFCTCNSSVRRSAFLSVGGFDENFEGASYGDDYDFAVRLARAGGQIVFDPTCEVVHLRAPLGGLRYADKQNEFAERDKALSGLLFCLRYWNEYKRWHMIYHYVLRRTVLRRDSVMRPTRLPAVLAGLARAYRDARRAAKEGPRSRFA